MHVISGLRGILVWVAAIAVLPAMGGAVLLVSPPPADASTPVLDYGADAYRYLQVPPGGGPSDFAAVGFEDTSFLTGAAPFGNNPFGCPLEPTTDWSPNTDLLVRRSIALPAGTTDVKVLVAIDNDVDLFWNGALLGSFTSEGCATYDGIVVAVPDGLLAGGANLLAARAHDRGVASFLDLEVTANLPPVCDAVGLSPTSLWPPNHTLRTVTAQGGVDPEGGEVALTVTQVTQDEPLDGIADGHTSPDAATATSGAVQLRAERSGAGDGRVYHVGVTATDPEGASCTTTVLVEVPHDQRHGGHAVDTTSVIVDSFGTASGAMNDAEPGPSTAIAPTAPTPAGEAPHPPEPPAPVRPGDTTAPAAGTPDPGRAALVEDAPSAPDPGGPHTIAADPGAGGRQHGRALERPGRPSDGPAVGRSHP